MRSVPAPTTDSATKEPLIDPTVPCLFRAIPLPAEEKARTHEPFHARGQAATARYRKLALVTDCD
jgi:hypothetical protein